VAQSDKPSTTRANRRATAPKSSARRSKTADSGRMNGSDARSRPGRRPETSVSGGSRRRGGNSNTPAGGVKTATDTLAGAGRNVRGPVLAAGAAAAVAAGAMLRRRLARKRHTVLGVRLPDLPVDGLVPSGGLDVKPIAKGISNAGKRIVKVSHQLAKLSDDVERVGKTAQKVGDSLT
jgi:hypothetical protein